MKTNSNQSSTQQQLVKLISLGDTEVGKSCLIKKYCEGNFVSDYVTTIGIDYGVKKITKNNQTLAINIFDFSGDDDYKLIRKDYISDFLGLLLVFDVNIKSTFENIVKWEKEAKMNNVDLSKIVVFLIGNKVDVKNRREVNTTIAKDFASARGYFYYETSAKTGFGVNEAFQCLFDELYIKAREIRSRFFY